MDQQRLMAMEGNNWTFIILSFNIRSHSNRWYEALPINKTVLFGKRFDGKCSCTAKNVSVQPKYLFDDYHELVKTLSKFLENIVAFLVSPQLPVLIYACLQR